MTATLTNGKPQRKQLSDQLDRLDEQLVKQDSILDALAEGLNQAVADAAKEGVKEAVQAAVVELLTNIELRAALHRATAPPSATRSSGWARLKAFARRAAEKGRAALGAVRQVVAGKVAAVKAVASHAVGPAWAAWQLRKVALAALGVGLVVAAVCYAASHGVASVVSGAGAAVTTVVVHTGLWVRKAARRMAIV